MSYFIKSLWQSKKAPQDASMGYASKAVLYHGQWTAVGLHKNH